jgi:hypothetical protein
LTARFNRWEDGGGSFVHNVGTFLPDSKEPHPRTVSAKGKRNIKDASCLFPCHVKKKKEKISVIPVTGCGGP